MKNIKKLLGIKDNKKKLVETLPVAEASYVKSPEEEVVEVVVTIAKDPEIAKRELNASMGNTGKMSAAHLIASQELNAAKKNYDTNRTSEAREQLMQELTNQALPIIEEITSLKKGLEASNQVCPNLDKFVSMAKSQLCYNAAANNTSLLGSTMLKLNEVEKNAKSDIQTPSISKDELYTRISNLLIPAGLIREEIQIFDKTKYETLQSIPRSQGTIKFDEDGEPIIKVARSKSFNGKKTIQR